MRKLILAIAALAILGGVGIAYAAPQSNIFRNILPESDQKYDNGTSTAAWLHVEAQQFCLTGDSCITTWPAGGGGGGSGSTTIAGLSPSNSTFILQSTTSGSSFSITTSSPRTIIFNSPANLLSTTTAAATYQLQGNYITALTGDGTASGPGSAALTLATVNSNVGTYGNASTVPVITVNGKGLVTAVSTSSIYSAFSASNPITFNGSTGAIGWTNSNNYITLGSLSGTAPINYNSGSGAISLTGIVPVANGGTATNTLANLTVSSSNLSITGGQQVLIGTSTQITLTANPTFTNLTTTNASTTGFTASAASWLQNVSLSGTLNVTGQTTFGTATGTGLTLTNLWVTGTPTLSGVSNCNSTQYLQITSGLFGCGTPAGGGGGSGGGWSTTTPGVIYNSFGQTVGINSSTPAAQLTVVGTSGTTTPVLMISSSTGASLLTVASNGSTTLSSLGTGIVHSSSAGLLSSSLIVNGDITNSTIDLTAKVTGLLPVVNGGTGANALTASDILFGNGTNPVATSSLFTFANSTGLTAPTTTITTTTTVPSGTTASILTVQGTDTVATNTTLNLLNINPTINSLASMTPATAVYAQNAVPTVTLSAPTTTITSFYNDYRGMTFTTGTITSYYGEYLAAPTVTASSTITNDYGLVTGSGLFSGFGSTSPGSTLVIQGGSAGNVLTIVSSAGANYLTITNAGAVTIANALTVNGSSVLAGLSATSISDSGTLSVTATSTLATTTVATYGYNGKVVPEITIFKFGNISSAATSTFSSTAYGNATSTFVLISPPIPVTLNSIACSLDSGGTLTFVVGTGAASTTPFTVTTSVVTSVPSLNLAANTKIYWQAGSAASTPNGLSCSAFGVPQ